MTFIVQGPYPLLQSTLVLPNPREGNQKNLAASIQTMRSMDGTLYTYVKTKRGRKAMSWDFLTTKEKAQEAKQFIEQYAGGLEFAGEGRAGGYPSGEVYRWTLSLEEKV